MWGGCGGGGLTLNMCFDGMRRHQRKWRMRSGRVLIPADSTAPPGRAALNALGCGFRRCLIEKLWDKSADRELLMEMFSLIPYTP